MSQNGIFIFMAGDNNLDIAGVSDLAEMKAAMPSPEVEVVVQFDRRKPMPWENPKDHGTKRLRLNQGNFEEIMDLGETNTGDPEVLRDFLSWGSDKYPAQRQIAILWNHGGGVKDNDIYKSVAGKVKSTLFVPPAQRGKRTLPAENMLKSFKKNDLKAMDKVLNLPERMVCTDDTSRDFLDNLELKTALKRSGKPFEIIAFDACLMNMFEVMYQLRDFGRWVIGSEEMEPTGGWPYQAILNLLAIQPKISSPELAKRIVELYGRSFEGTNEQITQSAIDLSPLDELATILHSFAQRLQQILPTYSPMLSSILLSVQRFREKDYIDLYDFLHLCCKNIPDPSLQKLAEAIMADWDKWVVAHVHLGEKVANSHGMAIFFPLKMADHEVMTIYRQLDFNVQFPGWLSLIEAFYTAPAVIR